MATPELFQSSNSQKQISGLISNMLVKAVAIKVRRLTRTKEWFHALCPSLLMIS